MTLKELAAGLKGEIEFARDGDVQIRDIQTDSRKVQPGALFVCIPGGRADGHDFAKQAVAAGAAALVCERRLDVDAEQLIVPSAREALAYLASAFYGHPASGMKIIGVTGTKGKTTVCFLVKSILEAAGRKVGLFGTVSTYINGRSTPSTLSTPDPLEFHKTLARMAEEGVEFVVMEVTAHALDQFRVAGLEYAATGFTNLSQDHFDYFHNMDNYSRAKAALSSQAKIMFLNADDELVTGLNSRGLIHCAAKTIGIRERADIYAKNIEVDERGCSFLVCFNKRFRLSVQLRMSGLFNVYNSLMAAALCDAVGIEPEMIRRGLEDIRAVPGRIELLDTHTPFRVILDYAHSPDALENVLSAVRETARGRLISLFGCGGDRDREKRPLMGEIGGKLSDFAILTSDNPRGEDPYDILASVEEGMKRTKCEYVVIENRRKAIQHALKMAQPGDVIVLAGKGHETYQEIRGVKHPFDEKVVVRELLDEMEADM